MAKKTAAKVAKKAPAKTPAETKPDVTRDRVEKFTSTLKCPLSSVEVAERADRAANLVGRINEKTDEAKAAQKHAKAEIDQLSAELNALSGEVASRVTYRPVECERLFAFAEGVMRETRLDTLELIISRKLTEHERQMRLPIDDDDQAWRETPLAQTPVAGLGDSVMDALTAHDITTLGSLSDFQAKHGDAWHQKIKGIGPETAAKIADASAEFWRQGATILD